MLPIAQAPLAMDHPLVLVSGVLLVALLLAAMLAIRGLWARATRLDEELRAQSLQRGRAEDAWLAAGFPLEVSEVAAIADQTVARFARDHRL